MKKLDLDVLAMLVAVADAGSFAAGAERVHRSPSALSMQIKALEEALGKVLFTRTTRQLTLTPEGHTLLGYARQMLALRDEAWAELVQPQISGKVRIGIPDDYAPTLLPPVLRKFSATYPRVDIQVIGRPSHELARLMKDNALDLACMTRTKGCPGEFLRREPLVWVGSSSRPAWKERPLPIAVFAEGSKARVHVTQALQNASIPYRMSYESPSVQGLTSMVDAGLAIAVLARCSVPPHLLQLDTAEGLPALEELEMVLCRGKQAGQLPSEYLAELILQELGGAK